MTASALVFACSDDASDKLGNRGGPGASSGGASSGGDGTNGEGGAGDGTPPEQAAFVALEPDFVKNCGNGCHDTGTYRPQPPTFLAGDTPLDVYKSVKAQTGIVTRDVYQSIVLTKGAHEGPAISDNADFEKKVIDWLTLESIAIQAVKLPSTDPITVTNGANDIDLCAKSAAGDNGACIGGLTGAHLTFNASLVGGILSLDTMNVVAAAGTDVHVLHPKFYRESTVDGGPSETVDPANSFSNTDTTVPGGATTPLPPGDVFFSAESWVPFDLTNDKIRIEFEKLEPGKVSQTQGAAVCKNAATFATAVLPSMKGGGGFNLNCSSCHGNGLAGMSLNGADNTAICAQVLGYIDQTDITKSKIITHVTVAAEGHGGGQITNTAGWTALFQNNQADFF